MTKVSTRISGPNICFNPSTGGEVELWYTYVTVSYEHRVPHQWEYPETGVTLHGTFAQSEEDAREGAAHIRNHWRDCLLSPTEMLERHARWGISTTKWQALDHLLLTGGNGCDWLEGHLIDTSFFDEKNEPQYFEPITNFRERTLSEQVAQTGIFFEEPLEATEPYEHVPSGLLSRVPKDITQEWLDTCIETAQNLLTLAGNEDVRRYAEERLAYFSTLKA